MNGRGEYGICRGTRATDYSQARVGFNLVFHTPADSDTAVRQIDTEMNAIVDAMYRAMGADTAIRKPSWSDEQFVEAIKREGNLPREARKDPIWKEVEDWKEKVLANKAIATKSPLWPFFEAAVSPIYEEWQRFHSADKYYTYFTSWEEYEKWLERAKQLRTLVKAKGVPILTPDPADLTKSLAEKTGEGLGDLASQAMSLMKWGVIGLLGIGGVVALSSVAMNLKKGRDPVEHYAGLYRGRRVK